MFLSKWNDIHLLYKYEFKHFIYFWINVLNFHNIIIIIIIIIIHTLLWHRLDQFMRNVYAMSVEWTKFSRERKSLIIYTTASHDRNNELRLCIKFVRDDCMLKNECSCYFKLLQQFRFHHHLDHHLETLHDWSDDLIVRWVNVLQHIWSKMHSVQPMHENMLDHLMTSFAVASRTIHAWNISWMQIDS